MVTRPTRRAVAITTAAVLLTGLTGCSGCGGGGAQPYVVPLSDSEKRLRDIVLGYMEAHEKLGRGPKGPEELKPHLTQFGNPDELLVSPDDGQPYVIVWGVDPSRGGPTEYQGMWQIIAYEKKGAGGKRAVVDIRGRPLTVPDGEFSQLKFAGRHRPSE
jgi:hypothetical protein